MGLVNYYQGNYQEAMQLYESSMTLAQKHGTKKERTLIIGYMGLIHQDTGNHTEAMKCFREKLRLAEELADKRELCL